MPALDCTLFILSYQGLHHLEALLPSVDALIEASPAYKVKVVVIENGKDTSSELFVKKEYPNFEFFYAPENDFLFSFNAYVQKAQSPFVFILNNDLRLDPNILNVSIPYLKNGPQLFAVTCTLMDWEGQHLQEAVKTASVKKGWLYLQTETLLSKSPTYSFNACGGASIYRTEMFNALGGFDPLYRPAYYEDTDLSHRAWNRGWPTINVPGAVVWHRTGGSWKNIQKKNELERMIHRNKIIGMIRNTRSEGFLVDFFLRLPKRLVSSFFTDKNFHVGLWKSLLRIPAALKKRSADNFDPKSVSLFQELSGKKYSN
jgi:GT2 family glycosyltransferase